MNQSIIYYRYYVSGTIQDLGIRYEVCPCCRANSHFSVVNFIRVLSISWYFLIKLIEHGCNNNCDFILFLHFLFFGLSWLSETSQLHTRPVPLPVRNCTCEPLLWLNLFEPPWFQPVRLRFASGSLPVWPVRFQLASGSLPVRFRLLPVRRFAFVSSVRLPVRRFASFVAFVSVRVVVLFFGSAGTRHAMETR